MRRATIEALNELNLRFYADRASSFSGSRQRPWAGWAHVLDAARQRGRVALSVLDLGCGNGRFGRYLASHWPGPWSYAGVDSSAELLAEARRSSAGWPARAHLTQQDVRSWRPAPTEPHDLVVAFGLMHHVPSFAARHALLDQAGRALAPGGLCAVAFWPFAEIERFRRKLVPWSERRRWLELDEGDLEPGDHLLRWGPAGDAVRYCHHCSPTEIGRLLSAAQLHVVDRFRTACRGDHNRYVLCESANR